MQGGWCSSVSRTRVVRSGFRSRSGGGGNGRRKREAKNLTIGLGVRCTFQNGCSDCMLCEPRTILCMICRHLMMNVQIRFAHFGMDESHRYHEYRNIVLKKSSRLSSRLSSFDHACRCSPLRLHWFHLILEVTESWTRTR